MLIHCPKCKFEQPKDDFCAKCGVHIPSYQPPEENIQQKALKSAGFYGFLFVCLVLGSGYYFHSKFKGFDQKIEEYNVEQLNELLENDPEFKRQMEARQEIENEAGSMMADIEDTIKEVKEMNAGPKNIKNPVIEALDWAKYDIEFYILEGPETIDIESDQVRQSGNNYEFYKIPSPAAGFDPFELVSQNSEAVRSSTGSNQILKEVPYPDGSNFAFQLKWIEEKNRLKVEIVSSYLLVREQNLESALSFSDYVKPGQWLLMKGFLPNIEFDIGAESIEAPFSIFRSEFFINGETSMYYLIRVVER